MYDLVVEPGHGHGVKRWQAVSEDDVQAPNEKERIGYLQEVNGKMIRENEKI